ncbi:MAG: hypothetical protein WAT81_05755 [Candidatus Moraniibacteriota bacterium]
MGKIIGLVVIAVFLIGGFLYWNSQQSGPTSMEKTDDGVTAVPGEVLGMTKEETGMASSIKEAMGLGQKMQCTYTMNEGGKALESKVVVDGKQYASTTKIDTMTVYGVFDGENQYSWTSATKTGMKMSKACLEKLQTTAQNMAKPTEAPATALQDMEKAFDMAKNVKCEPTSGADFTIPKDVIFTDQCAMMEQSMKMMEGRKDKLPAGMTVPSIPAAY